jgi:phage baseplate assembly protein V
MSAELTDLQQRLANLVRVGRVHSVDLTGARLRVSFGKDGANVSGWVPWMTSRAGATREWNPPAVGEQVVLMNPSGQDNSGFALPGGIYRTDAPANGTEAGKVVLDLPESGAWIIRVGDVVIEAADGSAKITVGGKSVEVTPSKILINGDVEVTGKINTTGDVIAGSISLQTHKHGGVQSGGSQTSTPV